MSTSGRRSAIAAVLLAVVMVGGGCSDAARVPKTAVSWAATAQALGEAWLAGDIPRTYAARATRAAREALVEQRDTVRDHARDVANAPALRSDLAALLGHVARLEAGIAGDDREVVRRAVGDIAASIRTLRPIARAERDA